MYVKCTHSLAHTNAHCTCQRVQILYLICETMDHVYEFIEPNSVVRKQSNTHSKYQWFVRHGFFSAVSVVAFEEGGQKQCVSNAKILEIVVVGLNYAFRTWISECVFLPFHEEIGRLVYVILKEANPESRRMNFQQATIVIKVRLSLNAVLFFFCKLLVENTSKNVLNQML